MEKDLNNKGDIVQVYGHNLTRVEALAHDMGQLTLMSYHDVSDEDFPAWKQALLEREIPDEALRALVVAEMERMG